MFYRRHSELMSKHYIGLKTFLQDCLSESEFYGDLVYKFKKIVGKTDFFRNNLKTLPIATKKKRQDTT